MWCTWPSQRRRLCMSIEGMLMRPARWRTSVFETLSCHLTCSRRRSERRWKLLIEASLLSSVGRPRLTAIEESRQDAGLVDQDLCPFAQQAVAPDSLVQLGHDPCSFGDPRADLFVERCWVCHGGAEVGKGFHHFKLRVPDGDGGWGVGSLRHDVGLLEADGQPELLAGSGQLVHEALQAL